MKVADMRTKTEKDLVRHADKLRAKLAEARSNRLIGEEQDVKTLRALKKELAQTLTVLKEEPVNERKEN